VTGALGWLVVGAAVLGATACQAPLVFRAEAVRDNGWGQALVVTAGERSDDNAPAAALLATETALQLRRRGVPAQTAIEWLSWRPPGTAEISARVLRGAPEPSDLEWLAAAGVVQFVVLRVERMAVAWHHAGRRGELALSATVFSTSRGGRGDTVTVLAEADGPPGTTFAALRANAVSRLADALAGRRAP
jgi:hypothetical protein